jgi:uncharacterized protein YndB with AHSA1/START domain
MSATTDTLVYERTLSIAAAPETVWEFFVDPEKLKRWMGIDAELDPRTGGVYRDEVIPGHTAVGEFVELDRPRRLVFTWGWELGSSSTVPPGSSTIEFDLAASGAGTRLRFRHSGLPTADAVERHGHGWEHYLGRLSVAAGGGDPGRDPWLDGPMS